TSVVWMLILSPPGEQYSPLGSVRQVPASSPVPHVHGVLAKDDDFSLRSRTEMNVNVVSWTKTSLIMLSMALMRRIQADMDHRDCWASHALCSPMPLML